MNLHRITTFLFLLLFTAAIGQAQHTLSTGGGSGQAGDNIIDFTLGQVEVGQNTNPNYVITPGFQQGDGIIDTLPYYNIGEIPSHVVYADINTAFHVWSRELGRSAILSIDGIQPSIAGSLRFDPRTGRFSITPDRGDSGRHLVVFRAILGTDTVFQDVFFDFVPRLPAEQTVFGLEPIRPVPAEDDRAFVSIKEEEGWTAISGKKVVFDASLDNAFSQYLLGANELDELEIYAEELILRSPLKLPGTNLTIYARSLILEGDGYIDTRPKTDGIANNSNGRAGRSGGDMAIFVGCFKRVEGKLFRLYGATGQASRVNTGGRGGNSGRFTSNLNLSRFVDQGGGPGGAGDPYGNRGGTGNIETTGKTHQWLHPHFLREVLAHAEAAYLNNHLIYTRNTLQFYLTAIDEYRASEEWEEVNEVVQLDLNQLAGEMSEHVNQIANHHDYFGNPAGWVPMLSFELNKLAFEGEVDRAMRILYLANVLQRQELTQAEKVVNFTRMRDELVAAMPALEAELVATLNQLDRLTPQVEDMVIDIENISADIQELETVLIDRAQYLVEERHKPKKKALWKRIAKTVGTIAQVLPIPGAQPVLAAVGTGLTAVSEIDFSSFSITETPGQVIGAIEDVSGALDQEEFKDKANAFLDVFKEFELDEIKRFKFPDFKPLADVAKDIYTSVDELTQKVGKTEAPMEEIMVELERLKAESPEFSELVNRVSNLMAEKTALYVEIQEANAKTTALTTRIQQDLLAITGFNGELTATTERRDLRTSLYVKDMARRARERLIKYHYNLARAYEYRLLKPYPNEIDLPRIFDQLLALMESFGTDELTQDQFESLRVIYDDALAEITVNILDVYNTNVAEKSTPVEFNLTVDDLANLNAGRGANLNLFRRGFIPVYEIGPRILEFEVIEVIARQEGSPPQSINNVDLRFEHSGITRLTSNASQHDEGQIYLFNHYAPGNANPIIWEARYDVESDRITKKSPSASSESLLLSLLQTEGIDVNNQENLLLYSRPGAWADIRVSKRDNNDTGAKTILEKVRIKVVYDFYSVSDDLAAVEVVTNNSMLPYISINKADNFDRKDGWGNFRRTYPRTRNGELTLTAPTEYGVWEFVEWSDFFGQRISADHEITVKLSDDQMLRANYRLLQPVLSVPDDTIWVDAAAGFESSDILNIGGGEMNWTVNTTTPWLQLTGGDQGVNNGMARFSFEENTDAMERIGALTIIAPESIDYLDTVIVIQYPKTTAISNQEQEEVMVISYYPNPTANNLHLTLSPRLIGGDLTLRDTNGSLKASYPINATLLTIPFAQYNSGAYFVEVSKGRARQTIRIVRQ